MRTLQTSGEVIDALGGTAEVARLLNRKMTAVSNWRVGNGFPANTYLAFQAALRTINGSAPDCLWGMAPAPAIQSGPVLAEPARAQG